MQILQIWGYIISISSLPKWPGSHLLNEAPNDWVQDGVPWGTENAQSLVATTSEDGDTRLRKVLTVGQFFRYLDPWPFMVLKVRIRTLSCEQNQASSQQNYLRNYLSFSFLPLSVSNLGATFWTNCSFQFSKTAPQKIESTIQQSLSD